MEKTTQLRAPRRTVVKAARHKPHRSSHNLFIDETSAVRQRHCEGEMPTGQGETIMPVMTGATPSSFDKDSPDPLSWSDSADVASAPSPLLPLSATASRAFDNPAPMIGLPLAGNIQHLLSDEILEHQQSLRDDERPVSSSTASARSPWTPGYGPESAQSPFASTSVPVESVPSITQPTILHRREAHLVKIFTQTWGPIFDCFDADQTFTRSVVRVALTSSLPLFWAVLATSALQLSRTSDYPLAAAQYYRSCCSKLIVPMLLDAEEHGAGEEAIVATYVMLRNYEHMTEDLVGKKTDRLFTAALAVSTNPAEPSSLHADIGRAAFWVHLRQDIHVALLLQLPISTDYPPCLQKDKILADLELVTMRQIVVRQESFDCAWANVVAVILSDVITYSFRPAPREKEVWRALRVRLDDWDVSKPDSFRPYFEQEWTSSKEHVFPEIWFLCDFHMLAWMYFHTAIVLLRTYPPCSEVGLSTRIPALGVAIREEILLHTRAICGIVTTNPNAQALIVLCHVATVSAIFFSDEREQQEVMKLLHMAYVVTGHPLHAVKQKLYRYWGTVS